MYLIAFLIDHHWTREIRIPVSSPFHLIDFLFEYNLMHFLFVVKVIAHICIHGDYPSSKPIVLIQLEDHKQGSTLTRLNSDVVLVCWTFMNKAMGSVCYALFAYPYIYSIGHINDIPTMQFRSRILWNINHTQDSFWIVVTSSYKSYC